MGKYYNFGTILLVLVAQAWSEDPHLPSYITPSHYSLDLVLDPRASVYDGLVEITFTSSNAVMDIIRLHASTETIQIQEALLNYMYACNVTDINNSTDIITLECPLNSISETNSLVIQFQGVLTTGDMVGLYKSTYKEGDEENVLLATQFEPIAARRAFPCFDEPALKATFDIFITHPNDFNALANTPVAKTFSVSPDYTQTQFETTPVMSTYLVAFVVSKFVSNSDNKTREYDDQVFSRPSVKDFTTTAATYAPVLIDLLSQWTGINYTDLGNTQAYQIAIPDFGLGAMENWGLITFKEVDILDDKDSTSNSVKQRIIATVAHELTHQWFGDYVTLDWWSDTWLNEGFATYFEYYIPDQLEDNLDTMRQFIVNELQPVLQVDSIPSALSLTSDTNTAAEFDNKFDDISYSKGASVVWMLRNILGEKAFKEGLQLYLKSNKYGNTDPSKLLSSFKAETSLGIDKIMDNWIYKSGFPLVTATLNESKVILTQDRFTIQNDSKVEATEWYIPISYTTSNEKKFDINISNWLNPNSTLEIDLDDDSWIILNIKQSGYYRVNYDSMLLHRIIKSLEDNIENVDEINRAQLVDDAFNIARAGRLSYEMVFHLAGYLVSETGYYPWVSAFNALSFISGKLNDDKAEDLLRAKILYWINKAFSTSSSSTGTEHVDKLKEVLILDWACKVGQEECNSYAKDTFESFKTNKSFPDYNKRGVVLCYGLRNSQNAAEDYNFLLNHFKESNSVVEQNEILSALGCTEAEDILSQYLSETISTNSSIRKQDASLVFRSVYSHSAVGVNVSLNFLEKNIDTIASSLKGLNALPNLILGLANRVISDDHILRLTKVINSNSGIEEIKLISQRAIEIMAANKSWRDAYAAEIKDILESSPNAASIPESTSTLLLISLTLYFLYHK